MPAIRNVWELTDPAMKGKVIFKSPGTAKLRMEMRTGLKRLHREATVISTLPSGMETTVKLDMNEVPLTAVVFGDRDFPVDRSVRFSFRKAAVLFRKSDGQNLAIGTLKTE